MLFGRALAGMRFYVWHCGWIWWIFRSSCSLMCVKLDWNPAGGGIGGKWACLSWLCSRQSWGHDPQCCCDTGFGCFALERLWNTQTFFFYCTPWNAPLTPLLFFFSLLSLSLAPLCRPSCYSEEGLHNNLQIWRLSWVNSGLVVLFNFFSAPQE